jgi:SecD/SecF fusion protein
VSTRRSNLFFILALVLALVGVALLAMPGSPLYQKPKLGLDLQGGLEIVLEAKPPPERKLTGEDLDRSVSIIRDRIDKLGVSETEVRKQGNDQIAVQIPGVTDPERAAEIIGKTAQLELYKLESNLLPPSSNAQGDAVATPSIFNLLASHQSQIKSDEDAREWYLFNEQKKRVAGPRDTKAQILGLRQVEDKLGPGGKLPKGWKFMGVPQKMTILTCGTAERYCPGIGENVDREYYYLLRHQPRDKENPVPEMTGEDLKLSGTRQDFDSTSGQPIVLMDFTDKGADKFHDVTKDIVDSSRFRSSQGRGKVLDSFAIVLDGRIKSAPTVDPDENPDGIPGDNGAQITGIGDVGDAKDLALVLQTGALPIEFIQVDRTQVSATLGKDSLHEALRASLAGLIIVALFLLVIYRFLGLVAVFGLAIYSALLYAVILLFDVTLTLPGFAGMILAIGVAADANIVIFERIKEEAAERKSIRAAIAVGYRKGFSTIVDANVVTAITALILFAVATGGVRGFAFMLLLGTGLSIVTAVFATRALLGLLAGFRWFDNPKFMGASAQRMAKWQMFDAVGKRRIWFSIAGVLIALSIGSLIVKGLNLGIDFRGGTQMTFVTQEPVEIPDVRSEATRFGLEGAVIQGRGDEVDGAFREFQIKSEPLSAAEQRQVVTAMENEFDASSAVRNVSASFSEEILRGAILAMLVSFLLITIYIAFRFQWRFAVPILRTIVNDGLIAIGIYSFSGREVTASTVAAFLTIIGYSIYDTIIVFDRVRENLPLMRRSSIKEIVNVSLWETVRRSIATTIIVLLPVTALYFFGGETLQDFAFAILIGIGISAFSTIFIAAPFLAVLLERAPEYKGRKDTGEAEAMRAAADGRGPVTAPEPEPEPEPAVEEEEVAPVPAGAAAAPPPGQAAAAGSAAAKRERRRQRRRARPHGRSR